MSTFERIKYLANSKKMSLQEIAEKAGIGKNSIYRWKVSAPNADKLESVAKVLDVSVDYLLGKTDTSAPIKSVDIADDNVIMTFEGKTIPKEDIELMKRLLRGKNDE